MSFFYMETYGCQMNIADSAEIQELLKSNGWQEATSPQQASLVIINTCSVRKTAEDRVAGRFGFYKALKRTHPRLKLAVMGCFAQKESLNLKKLFPVIDYVVGTRSKQAFEKIIARLNVKKPSLTESVYTSMENQFDLLPFAPEPNYPHRALISIIKGCDNFCSYCIVPYTRGREISLKSEILLEEIQKLAHQGVKEIYLLGQNVNSYGKEPKDISFAKLLEEINAISGIQRIKFMTSHPKDFSDELIDAVTGLEKISRHVHLPLQSASDRVLKQMNRNYTFSHYVKIIEKLRQKAPDISITTDLLIGFPGETEADFHETLQAVENLGFDRAFIFMYSPREGTASYQLSETVTPEEKQKRLQTLIDLQNQISAEKLQRFVGKIEPVLIDGPSKKRNHELTGFTRHETAVILPGENLTPGQMISVRIESVKGLTLRGIPC